MLVGQYPHKQKEMKDSWMEETVWRGEIKHQKRKIKKTCFDQ
jgi:hypothetical protein